MTAYFVAPDGNGDPTIWQRDGAEQQHGIGFIAKYELGEHQDVLWPVLVGVLTEDAETVERLARAIYEDGSWQSQCPWDKLFESTREECRKNARAVVGALRGGA